MRISGLCAKTNSSSHTFVLTVERGLNLCYKRFCNWLLNTSKSNVWCSVCPLIQLFNIVSIDGNYQIEMSSYFIVEYLNVKLRDAESIVVQLLLTM